MLPFEFTVEGPPLSLQTKDRSRLQAWKARVKVEAQKALGAVANISNDEISATITYYYENESPDVDNIAKPILDGMVGVCYVDDSQIVVSTTRKRLINGSYKIRGVSAVLLTAFSTGKEFLHIKLEKAEKSEELN